MLQFLLDELPDDADLWARLAEQYRIEIWFGIFLVILVETAQITPPVGFNLFVIQSMTNHDILYVARAAAPLFLLMILMLFLIWSMPQIVLERVTLGFEPGTGSASTLSQALSSYRTSLDQQYGAGAANYIDQNGGIRCIWDYVPVVRVDGAQQAVGPTPEPVCYFWLNDWYGGPPAADVVLTDNLPPRKLTLDQLHAGRRRIRLPGRMRGGNHIPVGRVKAKLKMKIVTAKPF